MMKILAKSLTLDAIIEERYVKLAKCSGKQVISLTVEFGMHRLGGGGIGSGAAR